MSKQVLDALKEKFGDAIVDTHAQFGDETAVVEPGRWLEIATFLRDDPAIQMNMFIDLTVVDYLGRRTPRFEVVLHVRSQPKAHRIRLKARVGDDDGRGAQIASLTAVWPGANWFEREAYDMFGVAFADHPDLRRILLYEEFEGHPLRKDYEASHVQPLIPYREDAPDKLPPFGPDEGMPFGRQTHMGVGALGQRPAAVNPPFAADGIPVDVPAAAPEPDSPAEDAAAEPTAESSE